ncbi:hydroxyacid dehydrogenase [Candidatus Sumerlaeota bacterium]|nr:hydroxyacid dehydrogenase [Candidatus Sumerlaeota bacterium]
MHADRTKKLNDAVTRNASSKRLKKAAFFNDGTPYFNGNVLNYVYSVGRQERIAAITELYPEVITSQNFEEHVDQLQELEVVFSTWGMPMLEEEQLRRLPNLKCLFYAAGASKHFRETYLELGVRVITATRVNAIPVAEFCLGQILLAMTGYFRNTREAKDPLSASPLNGFAGPGNFNETVALIGEGSVSEKLQELLRPFDLNVVVLSSFVKPGAPELADVFEKAFVISNHLADVDENTGIYHVDLFRRMREGAVFINTGRGRQVNEVDLIEALQERRDLTALLDVAVHEPPLEGSELYALPNVLLSTHIAGAKNNEVGRMADCMIDDFLRWESGQDLLYEVTPEML